MHRKREKEKMFQKEMLNKWIHRESERESERERERDENVIFVTKANERKEP